MKADDEQITSLIPAPPGLRAVFFTYDEDKFAFLVRTVYALAALHTADEEEIVISHIAPVVVEPCEGTMIPALFFAHGSYVGVLEPDQEPSALAATAKIQWEEWRKAVRQAKRSGC